MVRILWKWTVLLYPTASGANSFVALTPSATPILYASTHGTVSQEFTQKIRKNAMTVADLHQLDHARYFAARTSEIFSAHLGWPLPFDYGIISSGLPRSVVNVMSSLHALAREIERDADTLCEVSKAFLGERSLSDAPEFYKMCTPVQRELLWPSYIGYISISAIQVFARIKEIIEQGFSPQRASQFFTLLNRLHGALEAVSLCPPYVERLRSVFQAQVEKLVGSGMLGSKLNSTSLASMLFVAPQGTLRALIDELIAVLRREVNEKVSLDYASWIDGYEQDGGVKVEQHIAAGLFASHLGAEAVVCLNFERQGGVTRRIISYPEAARSGKDIQFDCIGGKIRVGGKPITSKNLPSQTMAIKLFSALLEAPEHKVHSRALPDSSYFRYRYEVQGKLTGPLIQLVRVRLKKVLPVKVSGGLTDFWISFDPKGFDIALIKKVL